MSAIFRNRVEKNIPTNISKPVKLFFYSALDEACRIAALINKGKHVWLAIAKTHKNAIFMISFQYVIEIALMRVAPFLLEPLALDF